MCLPNLRSGSNATSVTCKRSKGALLDGALGNAESSGSQPGRVEGTMPSLAQISLSIASSLLSWRQASSSSAMYICDEPPSDPNNMTGHTSSSGRRCYSHKQRMVERRKTRTKFHSLEDGPCPLWPRIAAGLLTLVAEGAGGLEAMCLPSTSLALRLPSLDAGPTHILPKNQHLMAVLSETKAYLSCCKGQLRFGRGGHFHLIARDGNTGRHFRHLLWGLIVTGIADLIRCYDTCTIYFLFY
jgi:hypothetical protein